MFPTRKNISICTHKYVFTDQKGIYLNFFGNGVERSSHKGSLPKKIHKGLLPRVDFLNHFTLFCYNSKFTSLSIRRCFSFRINIKQKNLTGKSQI